MMIKKYSTKKKLLYASLIIAAMLVIIIFSLRPAPICPHCVCPSPKEVFLSDLCSWLVFNSLPNEPLNPNIKDFKSIKVSLLPLPPKLDRKLIPNEYKEKLYYSPNGFIDKNGNKWHILLREKNKDDIVFTAIALRKNGDTSYAIIRNDEILIKQIEATKPAWKYSVRTINKGNK